MDASLVSRSEGRFSAVVSLGSGFEEHNESRAWPTLYICTKGAFQRRSLGELLHL